MTEQDFLRRFIFEELGVRGEWVKLATSWRQAKLHQKGGPDVQQQLGQALAAVVMLSAIVKFKGSMILQAQGDGDLGTLVAQSTDDRKIRGLVRSRESIQTDSLESMFGQGRLVLTIEPEIGEPYQGIVPLQGRNLASALQTYFEQSEQLRTRLWLFANETHAAGLMIQELPSQESYKQDWERIEILANTVTEKELLELDAIQLLHRLFHEEKVRLFDAEPVSFSCSCSKQKLEQTLRTFGRQELEEILQENGVIDASCEFCNEHFQFDRVDIEKILSLTIPAYDEQTRH